MILHDWLERYLSNLKTTNTINKFRRIQLSFKPYTRFATLTLAIVLIAVAAALTGNTKAAVNTHTTQVSAKQTEQSLTKNIQSTSAPIATTATPSQTINTTPEASAPVAATPPTLPKVQEDPTMSWINNYTGNGSITYQLLIDAVALQYGNSEPDVAISNPCQQTQTTVTMAYGIPAPPNATMNDYWQSALSNLTAAYQACLAYDANPAAPVQPSSNPSAVANSISDIQNLESAVTQYIEQMDSQEQSALKSLANTAGQ